MRDTYREHWRCAVEAGVLVGPSKVSLLYAWLAGRDRRNGAQIDRTGLWAEPGIRSITWSNTGFFRPFSYLIVYSYGLGTHMSADTTNGTAEDASIWAGRVDYAVASNLNVYGSFFWADRTNMSGYGWGFICHHMMIKRRTRRRSRVVYPLGENICWFFFVAIVRV